MFSWKQKDEDGREAKAVKGRDAKMWRHGDRIPRFRSDERAVSSFVLLCLSWEMAAVYKTMQPLREEDHRRA